jgi:hypothetical protein
LCFVGGRFVIRRRVIGQIHCGCPACLALLYNSADLSRKNYSKFITNMTFWCLSSDVSFIALIALEIIIKVLILLKYANLTKKIWTYLTASHDIEQEDHESLERHERNMLTFKVLALDVI